MYLLALPAGSEVVTWFTDVDAMISLSTSQNTYSGPRGNSGSGVGEPEGKLVP